MTFLPRRPQPALADIESAELFLPFWHLLVGDAVSSGCPFPMRTRVVPCGRRALHPRALYKRWVIGLPKAAPLPGCPLTVFGIRRVSAPESCRAHRSIDDNALEPFRP